MLLSHFYAIKIDSILKPNMPTINNNTTVAEIVTNNIKTADIFKKNGIDFCCGGHVSLKSVCDRKGLDYELIINDINHIEKTASSHNFDSWDLDFLTDYIINTHHKYVAKANEIISQYSNKVAQVHGEAHPEVIRINSLFTALTDELKMHMHKEEMILFPFIKQIANAKKKGQPLTQPPFGTIQNPINMMEAEHDSAGDIIKEISKLTDNFCPPEGACNTYKALYAGLEEYQNDLFQHIHLENNILFPKAIQLEKELLSE